MIRSGKFTFGMIVRVSCGSAAFRGQSDPAFDNRAQPSVLDERAAYLIGMMTDRRGGLGAEPVAAETVGTGRAFRS